MKAARFLLLLLLPASASANDLSGEWSYQSLGSADSNFRAEQKGDEVSFYRVLYPEFEGKRYQLEHLYRGKVSGQNINGKLFVREDGKGEFEPLRTFTGRIISADRLELDDLPLKRLGAVEERPPEPQESAAYSRVIIKREAATTPQTESPPTPKPTPKPAVTLPDLDSLLRVSRPLGEADKFLEKADAEFAARNYRAALQLYQKVEVLQPQLVEILYKLGWTHGALAVLAEKKGLAGEYIQHLTQAIKYWEKALHYDPYNKGAQENIRRARERLDRISTIP